jgi:hypothetical protein
LERQRIKDEIGALEERLELLEAATHSPAPGARPDQLVRQTLLSLQNLQDLIQEESLDKSLEAEVFLRRVTSLLVREAHLSGYDLAISTYGSGRISREMVEVSMGAILACLRASLKSFKGMGRALRVKGHLFYTFSVYLEVAASPDELHFRLLDDGLGYTGSFRTEFETESHFRRIRSHISRFGGWFKRQSLPGHGGSIEFKAALPMSRFEALSIRAGALEALIPCGCVAEVRNGPPPGKLPRVAYLSEETGLTAEGPGEEPAHWVKVAVADFQFWVACDSAETVKKARRLPADGLVNRGAWFRGFGVYHEGGAPRLLPLLEGEGLMDFYLDSWGGDESI